MKIILAAVLLFSFSTFAAPIDQEEIERLQEFALALRDFPQYKEQFEKEKKAFIEKTNTEIHYLQEYELRLLANKSEQGKVDQASARCFRITKTGNKIGDALADKECSVGFMSDGNKCYNIDQSGWLFGKPVDDKLCHHHYARGEINCYHADRSGHLYGKKLSPIFCE